MSPTPQVTDDPRRTTRVLVADAHDDTRALYRASLNGLGCDVVEAVDGRDALVKAFVHRPGVVVTELRLPIFDGCALCEILRRDPATRAVPIVVVTGETRETELDRAREAGADVVLVKPVTPEMLLREIQRVLRPADDPPSSASASGGDTPLPVRSSHQARFETTTPPKTPREFACPLCDEPLRYERSHIGGVRPRTEQWDEYVCPSCGRFEYRHIPRSRLRRIP